MCVLYIVFPQQFYQHPSYVQHSFSVRKIVENNECRTSNHRAQHEAKREHLKINGKVFPTLFPLSGGLLLSVQDGVNTKKGGNASLDRHSPPTGCDTIKNYAISILR